jgi:hypothetical protein
MLDGKLAEKVVQGTEVPEGWYDNPRLEENTAVAEPEVVVEPEIVAEPEIVSETVKVVTDIVDEQVSEAEPSPEPEAVEDNQ